MSISLLNWAMGFRLIMGQELEEQEEYDKYLHF